ncbi:MAG: large conductance mechanosensitive channel protein MscL [Myxococcaceae bacterium]
MWKDFRDFLFKQNALALAVGVVIGAAIGKVVSGIVDDLIMPLVGAVLPAGDWRTAELQLAGANSIKYGDLIGRVVDFLIIALVVFAITKVLLNAPPPATKDCPECLEKIPLLAKRCRACTAVVA